MLLLPLKLRSGAGLLPFGVSTPLSGSDRELKLLLQEHRVEIIRKRSEFLGGGGGGGYAGGGGGGGDVADVYGDGVGDIRLSKKNPLGVQTTGVCCYR